MLPAPSYTRVAVVQLAYHPAIVAGLRSPLEDPLYSPRQGDSLLPPGGQGPMSPALKKQLEALRTRVREAYDAQLLAKLKAVLDACRAWKVRLVVFPEYSIPWEILGGVADAAGDMVVVAGTHTVERAARRQGIYERLVAPGLPSVGQSVCPVLHQGRLLALQPKLNPAVPERESMKPGEAWSPVALPAGLPGPMGVLICLDFLFRESERTRDLIAGRLKECRFLAIPSLTPHHTLPEFAGKAWEEAWRYGRPVLYCDSAEGGGTSLYVDEGSPADLRQFPERAGYLEPGDEGVIVADVNLGHERPGPSTRYDAPRAILPMAEATLVYQAQPAGQAYAGWLTQAAPLLAREDDEALEALVEHVEQGRDILLNAGALSGARARDRRLRRLADSLDKVTSLEDLRRFTREVVLPPDVLPLEALRGAMARGAADAVFQWLEREDARAAGLSEVEVRLRKAAEAGRSEHAWAAGVLPVLGAVASAVRGEQEVNASPATAPAPEVRVVLPSGLDPAALGVRRHAGWVLSFKAKPGDFRAYGDESRGILRVGERLRGGDVRAKEEPPFVQVRLDAAEELFSLAIAEGAERVAVVAVWEDATPQLAALLIAVERAGAWTLWSNGDDGWWVPEREHHKKNLQAALRESGLVGAELVRIQPEPLYERILALLPRFESREARARVEALREGRLREVQQQFIQPDALVDDAARVPVLEALDAWLGSEKPIALVLGEFGSGKSTALAEWARVHWAREAEIPRLLLASLAGASTSQDAEALLLEAAALDDAPAHRAGLRVLVRRSLLVPCFDGFDEMATRLEASELAGRLSELLSGAGRQGKVLVSSRTHYFSSEEQLRTAVTSALTRTLGQSAGFQRIELQPLTGEQVEGLVRKILPEQGQADHALDRIARTYDLQDLVHRPLLLGMVLKTLDQLAPGSRVGRADLYEAYLARWLEQTRSADPDVFTDEQKIAFAESLAEGLWNSGRPDCTWQELQKSVRARLVQLLPDSMPVGAAHLEIQGGAFFVHEGEDRYRFAHKSFLEYFLARALVHTLPERPLEALRTRPLTPEVAAFVGEILRREGEPRATQAVRAVQRFLTEDRPLAPDQKAAANAVRLLLGIARWAGDSEGWFPERADLRGVVLVEEDLRGARLVGANLAGAELSASDLSDADLSDACLDKARLAGTRLFKTRLGRVQAREADFTLAEADQALLAGADLRKARLRQSTWMRCQWRDARLDGAEISAWLAPASEPAWPQALSITRGRLRAALVTGHVGAVNAVAWDAEGQRLASGGDDGTVRVWEVGSGRELARLEGHGRQVNAVAWDAEGQRLASGGDDGTVRVWEVGSGRELARLEGPGRRVLSVAWDAEGRRLAAGGSEGTVRVWEAGSGRELARLEGQGSQVRSVAWDAEGRRLAAGGSDRTVRVWEVGSGRELARLEGHERPVWSVAWDAEGRRLASGGDDGTVRVWEAESGRELARLEGHGSPVRSVAWDAEGRRLASGGADGMVRVWEVESGRELARLEGHGSPVRSVAWDAEGQRLASGGADGTVGVWGVKQQALLGTFLAEEEAAFVRTPRGFCLFATNGAERICLALNPPGAHPNSEVYLPLSSLRDVFHNPDKVTKALAGEVGGDTVWDELERLGLGEGTSWNGDVVRMPPLSVAVGPPPVPHTEERALAPNPFHPGPALIGLPSVPGREAVLSDLRALIESRSPAVLRGPRRAGKTSILHALALQLASTHTVRHVSLEARRLVTEDDLACALEPSLAGEPAPASTLRARLREEPASVLLIDEIANLRVADASVFAWLRAVGQESTSIVLVGSHWDWVEVVRQAASAPGSSFGNDVTPVNLGPLPETDALDFLVNTAPPDVPLARDGTARWIIERCGTWPFYLQVLGYAVVQAVRTGGRQALIEPSGVTDLYENRLLVDRDVGFFRTRWAELPERARAVLWRVRSSPDASLPQVRALSPEDRKILRDTGLCDSMGRWLEDKPFCDWLRRIADEELGRN